MASTVEIEDIEELRRSQGIEDVELRAEIRSLRVGDSVNLTFKMDGRSFDVVPVRITQIRGISFRGKLTQRALSIPRGRLVLFTIAHIHSVAKRLPQNA
jgi:hypothetical protein